MKNDFINLTEENVSDEHLCCIIRSRKPHSGISAKREWLSDRLKEGHVFRKLNVKGTVFIEYAPLETAWVPIEGSRYYYIYCLWATGEYKGKAMASSCWNTVSQTPKQMENPEFVFSGQKSRKPGLQISPFLNGMDFRLWILQKAAMSCWHYPLMGHFRNFVKLRKKRELQIRTLLFSMICSVHIY